MDTAAALSDFTIVDLTQTLGVQTALWPGSRSVAVHTTATLAKDGYYLRDVDIPEHAGTHLDAPSHFTEEGQDVDAIPVSRLVVPAVVIDVSDEVGDDRDATVGVDAVHRAEEVDRSIPSGAAVLIRTGWDRYVYDAGRYIGREEPHCPGIGTDLAELLIERGVVGIGIDTLGIDPGSASDCPVHQLTLDAGLWHLEGLVNLNRVPARGALLFVGVMKIEGGSGAPARVMALVPQRQPNSH